MRLLLKQYWVMVLIVVVSAFFRYYSINWDSHTHLHPDERFLTMVTMEMQNRCIMYEPSPLDSSSGVARIVWVEVPSCIREYFNVSLSHMNPYNIGREFYVYGILPLTLVKLVAQLVGYDTYNGITIVGRILSATADMVTLLFVGFIAYTLVRKYRAPPPLPIYATGAYAIAVLPIQLSHFFTTDIFLSMFMIGSFYMIFLFATYRHMGYLVASGILFGFALACKVNAIYISPLIGIFIVMRHFDMHKKNLRYATWPLRKRQTWWSIVIEGGMYALVAYLALRIGNPYYFANSTAIIPSLHPLFLSSIEQLQTYSSADVWYPPGVQWWDKIPVWFSLWNMALFGWGMPLFFAAIIGMVEPWRKNTLSCARWVLGVMLGWVLLFFLYQSTQFVKALRYFIFLYPLLAIFAGYGLHHIYRYVYRIVNSVFVRRLSIAKKHAHSILVASALLGMIVLLVWPLMFLSIYMQPHSRVQASYWMYEHMDLDDPLLFEHWDDPLPLRLPEYPGVHVEGTGIAIFSPDTPGKWFTINRQLAEARYYVLSSNRGWGSIPTVPDRYPRTAQFYDDLFAGRTDYKKIADFTSYPSLRYLGIPLELPDDWADETFTVYDHPRVMIFENMDFEAPRRFNEE